MSGLASSGYTGPDKDARGFLAELVAILEEQRDHVVLIGGMAYNIWREPRYTKDLDFVIVARQSTIDEIQHALENRGFITTRLQHDPDDGLTSFVRLVDASGRKVIEFQTAQTDFQQAVVARGVQIDPLLPFRVATPEDLIVLKLIAGRSKDYTDIVSLSEIDGLEWPYIEHWCGIWEVTDRLRWLRELIDSRP